MADPMEGLNQPGPIDKDGNVVLGPSNQQSVKVDPFEQETIAKQEKEITQNKESEQKAKEEEVGIKLNLDGAGTEQKVDTAAAAAAAGARATTTTETEADAEDTGATFEIEEDIEKLNDGFTDITNGQKGIFKKILHEGVGPSPLIDSRVTCHYTGTLTRTGVKFDSSRDRNDPFKFTIGRGEVIKGWDIGIASMKIGEKAILRCSPDFAYGRERGTGSIPPNSWLDFEVELINWNDFKDVDDGRVSKKQLKRGKDSAFDKPKQDGKCILSYVGKYFKDPNVTQGDDYVIFSKGDKVEFVVEDDDSFCEGFHIAVKDMIKEEVSLFKLEPSVAFGFGGNKELGVPPNTDVFYEITLHNFENEKEQWQMNDTEYLAKGEKVKQQGNDAFKAKNIRRAKRKYEQCVQIFEDNRFKDNEKKQADEMLCGVKNNLALIAIKEGDFVEAISKCNDVLTMDPNNGKALGRRGQAYLRSGEFERAKDDLTAALKLMPQDAGLKELLRQCKAQIKKYRQKERDLFKNAFKAKKKKTKKNEKMDESEKKDETSEAAANASKDETEATEATEKAKKQATDATQVTEEAPAATSETDGKDTKE